MCLECTTLLSFGIWWQVLDIAAIETMSSPYIVKTPRRNNSPEIVPDEQYQASDVLHFFYFQYLFIYL